MTKHRIILGMQRQQQIVRPSQNTNRFGDRLRMGRAAHADLSLPSLRRCFVSQGGSSLSDGSRLSRNTEPTCA
ncbi:unnamed protein product [Lampetra planeri]